MGMPKTNPEGLGIPPVRITGHQRVGGQCEMPLINASIRPAEQGKSQTGVSPKRLPSTMPGASHTVEAMSHSGYPASHRITPTMSFAGPNGDAHHSVGPSAATSVGQSSLRHGYTLSGG